MGPQAAPTEVRIDSGTPDPDAIVWVKLPVSKKTIMAGGSAARSVDVGVCHGGVEHRDLVGSPPWSAQQLEPG